jgi:hypothetical protein
VDVDEEVDTVPLSLGQALLTEICFNSRVDDDNQIKPAAVDGRPPEGRTGLRSLSVTVTTVSSLDYHHLALQLVDHRFGAARVNEPRSDLLVGDGVGGDKGMDGNGQVMERYSSWWTPSRAVVVELFSLRRVL